MIFIFGYHPVTKVIGPVEEKECPNCHNRRHWVLGKTTYFISLFFIPVIPTKVNRYQSCPVCNYQEDLAESEFASSMGLARLNKEAVSRNMSEKEYEERLGSL